MLKDETSQTLGQITKCLNDLDDFDEFDKKLVLSKVYSDLRSIAFSRLRDIPPNATIQATSLVNEAYLRMFKGKSPSWDNRHHFYWAASRAMRDVLVENARKKFSQKRGGGVVVLEIDENETTGPVSEAADLLHLDEAITKLEYLRPIAAEIVMLRFFGGMTRSQVSNHLDLTESAVWREWDFARAWLHAELSTAD